MRDYTDDYVSSLKWKMWIFLALSILLSVLLWEAGKRNKVLEREVIIAKATVQAKEQEIYDFNMEAAHSVFWAQVMPKNAKALIKKMYEEEKIKHLPEYP